MTAPGPAAANQLYRAAEHLTALLDRPLAFFDLETTGTSVTSDRIVELGWVILHPSGDRVADTMRFDPGVPIPAEATAVHGITDEDVAGRPLFGEMASGVHKLFVDCDLAGFNIRRFDLPLLLEELKRAGYELPVGKRRIIDLLTIFHRENPRDLEAAVERYLHRPHRGAHAALADTEACVELLVAQMEAHGLPRSVEGLHAYCDETSPFETEVEKWFDVSGPVPVFRRGKYSGRKVTELLTDGRGRGYLDWMITKAEDMAAEVKQVAIDALNGGYR